jgi:hypothetical protein
MASRVQNAIAAWWAAHPELSPLTSDGRLWHGAAPEGVALPYLVYLVTSGAERDRTTAYYFLDCGATFSAYAETDVEAAAIRNEIRDAIRSDAAISDEGETPLHCLPGNQSLAIAQGKGPEGTDCWLATVEVSIPWQRNP